MMNSSPDFPAAHSMDTTWFAVDEAGHVAAFFTGENGYMPKSAPGDFDDYFAIETILSVLGPERLKLDPAYLPEVPRTTVENLNDFLSRGALRHAVVEVRSAEDLLRPEWQPKSLLLRLFGKKLRSPCFLVLRKSDPTLIWICEAIKSSNIEKLVREGVILRIFSPSDFWDSEIKGFPRWLGFYQYSFPDDLDEMVRPYRAEVPPTHPVCLKSEEYLKAGFSGPDSILSAVRFRDGAMIQPLEFASCRSYDRAIAYVGSDGQRLLPLPGMEEEFEARKTEFEDALALDRSMDELQDS